MIPEADALQTHGFSCSPPLFFLISLFLPFADVWNYQKKDWGTSDVRDRSNGGNEQSGFQGWESAQDWATK